MTLVSISTTNQLSCNCPGIRGRWWHDASKNVSQEDREGHRVVPKCTLQTAGAGTAGIHTLVLSGHYVAPLISEVNQPGVITAASDHVLAICAGCICFCPACGDVYLCPVCQVVAGCHPLPVDSSGGQFACNSLHMCPCQVSSPSNMKTNRSVMRPHGGFVVRTRV